jgi:hypothetical protein
MRSVRFVIAMLFSTLFLLTSSPECAIAQLSSVGNQAGQQSKSEEPAFTDTDAAPLLDQLAEGLQSRIANKVLSVFDLSRMNDGEIFREQITAFFRQYDSIRVHFKLLEVNGKGLLVDAELDATPNGEFQPPEHKRMELRFTAAKSEGGWKFIDVQPRSFFS